RPPGAAPGRDEIQLRGVPGEDAAGVRGALRGAPSARPAGEGRRVTQSASEPRSGDHYSYAHYANERTARTFDDLRFGGPIGSLVASSQAKTLSDFVGRIQHRRILDVGTGTGRAALLFARGGARVTAVDASPQMLEVARARADEQGIRSITF